jgi:hypothetical protein
MILLNRNSISRFYHSFFSFTIHIYTPSTPRHPHHTIHDGKATLITIHAAITSSTKSIKIIKPIKPITILSSTNNLCQPSSPAPLHNLLLPDPSNLQYEVQG